MLKNGYIIYIKQKDIKGKFKMRVIVCNDYNEMSEQAAKLVAAQIFLKPESVIGFATGSTPVGLYKKLIERYEAGEIDFSKITAFNLDEYYPIAHDNDQSYKYFMQQNLFSKVNVNPEKLHIPDGETKNPAEECENYERAIAAAGGIDLQILGIGQNGHIGFNEPSENLDAKTHLTDLTESTISANSRFFEKKEDVPTKALTMGIATILKSRKIIMLASGRSKNKVIGEFLNDSINTNIPASMLKVHSDVVLICDREAYASMRLGIDIGGSSIKIGVIGGDNAVASKLNIPVRGDAYKICDDIAAACKEFMKEYPALTVGVGVPGFVNGGKVTSYNLPFDNFDLKGELAARLGMEVYVDNDANSAALGEALAGTGKGEESLLMVTLGTGIGGGIIIDGKIYRGAGGAGEIGHMCVQADGIECPCGQKGCWEQYASVGALIKNAVKAAKDNPDSILAKKIEKNLGRCDGKLVFEALDEGCETAKNILEKYFDYLAIGLNSIINIFNPGMVVLGGAIAESGDALLLPIKERLKSGIPIKVSRLANDAGITGAALLATMKK